MKAAAEVPDRETPASRARRRLMDEAMAIEREDAARAGMVAYMARILALVALPHADPALRRGVPAKLRNFWERENGWARLQIIGHPKIGLPYGKVPRELLIYFTTAAVKTGESRIVLGHSLADFLARLNMGRGSGGVNGSIGRLRIQLQRLLTSTVSAVSDVLDAEGARVWRYAPIPITRESQLCWHPRHPEQVSIWQSWVDLSEDFFAMVTDRPVPIDRRAIRALRSPLGIDLYVWLTYRLSYLEAERTIPWELLERQFGGTYLSVRDFRRAVREQLVQVLALYPRARITVSEVGLVLRPSPPHVARFFIVPAPAISTGGGKP